MYFDKRVVHTAATQYHASGHAVVGRLYFGVVFS